MKPLKSGFTLIEAIIVMVVLASSMTAALYLLTTVVFSTQQNLARTKAVYLAQECHELARNLRDTAWKNYQPWDCAFGSAGDEFIIDHDYTESLMIPSCNNLQPGVSINAFNAASPNDTIWQDGNIMSHQSTATATDTGYRRRLVHTDPDSSPATLDLECQVDWNFNGRDENVTSLQTLTNWRRN